MEANKNKRSLKQLIVISVGALFLILLAGSFLLSFATSRAYVESQLSQHSREAATFLGLSLSSIAGEGRQIEQLRMIDALFDSGDYQIIRFENAQGKEVVTKTMSGAEERVPVWFASMLEFDSEVGVAQVMAGWQQQGKVLVQSNTELAYEELWQMFKLQVLWFSLVTLIGLFGLYFLMRKLLMPLADMEKQARDLSHSAFKSRVSLPNTRELESVAVSMNEMSASLERVFDDQLNVIESLRDQSRKDSLTHLFNRDGFDARLRSDLSDTTVSGQGALLLVVIKDFDSFNAKQGRSAGDTLLCEVAGVLNQFVERRSGAYAARRGGAQFSVFVPAIALESSEDLASSLLAKLLSLPAVRHSLRDDTFNIGLAMVEKSDSVKNLLSKADLALRQAQAKDASSWQRYVPEGGEGLVDEVRQANHWQAILQNVLAKNQVILHQQVVRFVDSDEISHHQVLSRIEHEGHLIVASTFLPMARRFGMMVLFDRLIVERVLTGMSEDQGRYHITLSEAAIMDDHFMAWLVEQLPIYKEVLPRVTFEVPEHALGFGEALLQRFAELGAQWGFKLCIDRFGVSAVPFSYLQRIAVSALKIDQSFIRGINVNLDNQFFLRAVVQIAHSQNIQVIAIGVESQEELETLRKLGIDAAMGYVIEHAEPASF